MKVVATKLKKKSSPVFQLIMGIDCLFCSLLLIVALIYMFSVEGMTEPSEIIKVILYMGGLAALFVFLGVYMIKRFAIWRTLPDVIAEFDGRCLYIHGEKEETEIHVFDLKNARVYRGTKYLKHDIFIWRKGKKRLSIPFTDNPCETVNRLTSIVNSIKV